MIACECFNYLWVMGSPVGGCRGARMCNVGTRMMVSVGFIFTCSCTSVFLTSIKPSYIKYSPQATLITDGTL